MRNLFRTFVALSLSLLAPSAFAYSAVINIADLIAMSDVVVLAEVFDVRSVRESGMEVTMAMADVRATWKGRVDGSTVEYVASPGWFLCDTSDAKSGETVLLFLKKDPADGRLHIARYGRGRMPVIDGARPQVRPYEVIFPLDRDVVDLQTLERMVRNAPRRPPS